MVEEIKIKIQQSILGEDDKFFLLQNLDNMSESQQSELLAILVESESKLVKEVEAIKSESFTNLSMQMMKLAKEFSTKARVEIEKKNNAKETVDLKNLDESLKNI